MSYTADNQKLSGSLNELWQLIRIINERIDNRIEDSSEWNKEHITELNELQDQLTIVKRMIARLKDSTR